MSTFPKCLSQVFVHTECGWVTEIISHWTNIMQFLACCLVFFGFSWATSKANQSWVHIQWAGYWTWCKLGLPEGESLTAVLYVSQQRRNNMHGLGVSHRDQSGPPARAQRPLSTGVWRGDTEDPLTHTYTRPLNGKCSPPTTYGVPWL